MAISAIKIKKSTTVRTESLQMFFNDISKYKPLKKEEETQLFENIKNGCKKSREKLFNHNVKFVVSVAKNFGNKENKLSDLVQEGSIGLLKAIDRFDLSRGFKFISYAVWYIRQSIMEFLQENEPIRTPVKKLFACKVERMYNEFVEHFGIEPSLGDYEYFFDLCPREISDLRNFRLNLGMQSTDAPLSVSDENDTTIGECLVSNALTPEDALEAKEVVKSLREKMSVLTTRQRTIMEKYHCLFEDWDNMYTLAEIGENLNITRERVRQEAANAKKLLQTTFKRKHSFKGKEAKRKATA